MEDEHEQAADTLQKLPVARGARGKTRGAAQPGTVAIVGTGPGDPELLTLRALRAIESAEVLVYDRLIGPEILDHAPIAAERLYVGKAKGHHSRSQAEINALMVSRARSGQRVVRLKGGDPFVFGRGGEEVSYLQGHGVPFEIVPGVTAATGCAASAGIPLTHRGVAGAVTFVTGHDQEGVADQDWQAMAQSGHTLVVYMGVSTAGAIAARLIANGMSPAMPVAIIENGTRTEQRTLFGSLANLGGTVSERDVKSPALIVIGEVVREAMTGDSTASLYALAV